LISIISFIFHLFIAREKELSYEKPEEFIEFQLDFCQNQVSFLIISFNLSFYIKEKSNLKSQAAKLLEILIDHIDGSLTITSYGIFSILEDNLFKLSNEISPEAEDKIVISLDFLSILSYSISRREDLRGAVEDVFMKNMSYFSSREIPHYLRSKVFLFYGLYMDCLFVEPEKNEIYLKILEDLIQGERLHSKSVELQALDSLNELVFNENFQSRNIANLERILLLFLEDLNSKKHEMYFEALEQVIKFYFEISKNEKIMVFTLEELIKKLEDLENMKVSEICLKILMENLISEKINQWKLNEYVGEFNKRLVIAFNSEKKENLKFLDERILTLLTNMIPFQLNQEIFIEIVKIHVTRYRKLEENMVRFINNFFFYNCQNANVYESLTMVIKNLIFFEI